MRNFPGIKRWGSVFFAGLFGCYTQATPPVTTRPVTTRPATAQPGVAAAPPTSKPFLFNEAGIPAGFPPPGPVGVVMIKQYPVCREARVKAAASEQDSGEQASGEQGSMFMSLFNHIKTNDIPMTSPVEMTWDTPTTQLSQDAKLVAMAFVYGRPTTGKPGMQGKVDVVDLPAQTFVSIGVRGGYNQKNLKAAVDQLRTWLAARPGEYTVTGLPRYLGYNSPFVPPFMRFGEVQLPVVLSQSEPRTK
jgi:hypothetical protein